MDFGCYLESCIRKKDISINALAKMCGINRGGLYSIFKNERKLKEDKLFELIRIAGLNSTEEKKLVHLFFCDYFGESEFQRIESLLDEIQRVGRDRPIEQQIAPFEKKSTLVGEAEICSALKLLIDTNDTVTTNFSYSCGAIDQLFYSAVCGGALKELRHIITLSEEGDHAHNYKTIFSSFKYMYAQSFPYYQWGSVDKLTRLIAFPNFAIGSQNAVLFDNDWGIFIDDPETVSNLNNKFAPLLKQCQKFGRIAEDDMEVKQLYQDSFSDRGEVISFQSYLCVAPYVDYELIFNIVREQLPQRELLAKIGYEYYKNVFQTVDFLQFATIDGLKRFAETGNVAEVSGALVQPAGIEDRIKILRGISRAAESEHFFIFDDQKFYMPRDFAIEKYTGRLMFGGFDRTVPNFGQRDKFLAELDDISLINTFHHAAEYLIHSRKVHSKDFTLRLIDELLLKLTNHLP